MTGILVSLQMDDIIETCILSAIGAIVATAYRRSYYTKCSVRKSA